MTEKQAYPITLFSLIIVIFSAIVGINEAKSIEHIKQNKLIAENQKLRHENDKCFFVFNSCIAFKNHHSNYSDQQVIQAAKIIWNDSDKYNIPQLKELWHQYLLYESGYKDVYGTAGERTCYQFKSDTYFDFTGEYLTEEKINDLPGITKVWAKMIALYTFTFFDNEKVAIAYNSGQAIFRYIPEPCNIKRIVYNNHNLDYYPECINKQLSKIVNYNY